MSNCLLSLRDDCGLIRRGLCQAGRFGLGAGNNGQVNGKGGAMLLGIFIGGVAGEDDVAAEFGDNAVAHGQAQAGALAGLLGGEEGVEDFGLGLPGDTGAGVGEFDGDAFAVGGQAGSRP